MRNYLTKKNIYYLICIFLCLILVLPVMGEISPLQISDGIPMLGRINDFLNGKYTLSQYLLTAHGNSIHALVYLIALFDGIFFNQSILLLKIVLCFGMLGTGMFIVHIMWRDYLSFWINLFSSFIVLVFVLGTYNMELYLPFQMVLSLSRLFYLLIIWEFSKSITKEKVGSWKWVMLIVLASIVCLCHGMGMLFAGAIFYIHIVSKQKIKYNFISLIPFVFYNMIQLIFNSGYGEVTTSKFFFLKYSREFILSLFAYYGGPLKQFFGAPRIICIVVGGVLFVSILIILFIWFIKGIIAIIRGKEEIQLVNTKIFILALLGMSFLASIGSASFMVARIDLVPEIAVDPVGTVLETGRYLVYSVVPYIGLFYLIIDQLKKVSKKIVMISASVLFVCFLYIVGIDINATQTIINSNKTFDMNAVALLSSVDYDSQELQRAYGDFSGDWYWGEEIPKLYKRLCIEGKYVWNNLPVFNSSIGDIMNRNVINVMSLCLSECSDDDYFSIEITTAKKPINRYSAILDSEGKVIGFAYIDKDRGIYFRDGKLFFDGYFHLRGYITKDSMYENGIFVLNEKVNTISGNDEKISIYETHLADLTDENWTNGVAKERNCLLLQYSDELLEGLETGAYVSDGDRTIYDIDSYDTVDDLWIRVFVSGNSKKDNLTNLQYPNKIYILK